MTIYWLCSHQGMFFPEMFISPHFLDVPVRVECTLEDFVESLCSDVTWALKVGYCQHV
jgi:hypothetical protein